MTRLSLPRAVGRSLTLALALLAASPAQGDPTPSPVNRWVTGGPVTAAVRAGDYLFVGGDFGGVYPSDKHTGPFAVFTPPSEVPVPLPLVRGESVHVGAIVDDGQGGWIVGGRFEAVGAIPAAGLVHIRSDGTVVRLGSGLFDVFALARYEQTLLVVPSFSATDAGRLVAVDLVTGTPLSWTPAPNGNVRAIAVANGRLYAIGAFSQIAGAARNNAASFDLPSLTLTAWSPAVPSNVIAIDVVGSTMFLAGEFSAVGGIARQGLAAIDTTSGALLPWAPQQNCLVMSIRVTTDRAYLGGCFTSVNGTSRSRLAAVDPTSGALAAWNPAVDGLFVNTLHATGSTLFASGDFLTAGGTARAYLAAFDATSGSLLSWNPAPSGSVVAVASAGSAVAIGGEFQGMSALPRQRIAQFDLRTGAPTSWQPSGFTEISLVRALATDGQRLYAAGTFYVPAGGNPYAWRGLVALEGNGAWIPGWNPGLSARALTVVDGRLFATGYGPPAAIDPASGAVLPWNAQVSGGEASSLLGYNSALFIAGSFTTVGGLSRAGLAKLDTTTGAVSSWNPAVVLSFGSLLARAGEALLVSDASPPYQRPVPLAAVHVSSGALLGAVPLSVLTSVRALAATDRRVFVGDGARLRTLDAATGALLAWGPAADGTIQTIYADDTVVVLGGPFTDIAGVRSPGLAIFQEETLPGPPSALAASVQESRVTLTWQAPASGGAPTGYVVEAGTAPGLSDLATVAVGQALTFSTTGVAFGRYFVRVRAMNASGASSPSNEVVVTVGCAGPPGQPTTPVVSGSAPNIVLTWAPGSGPTPESYRVHAGTVPGVYALGTFVAASAGLAATVAPGTYFVAVHAVNACGASALSGEAIVIAGAPPPGGPTALTASVSGHTVTFTWTAASGTVLDYVLDAGNVPDRWNLLIGTSLGAATSAVFSAVPAGTFYVRVRAVNGNGSSPASNTVLVTVTP